MLLCLVYITAMFASYAPFLVPLQDTYFVLRLNSRRKHQEIACRAEANEVIVHLEEVRVVDYAVPSNEGSKEGGSTSSSGPWADAFVNMP